MDSIKSQTNGKESEILFSRSIKAGKRIYYLDVKCDRKGEAYLSLTESKRLPTAEGEAPAFEKHKIFIYPEDFDKFSEGLSDVLKFAQNYRESKLDNDEADDEKPVSDDFKIDIEF